VASDKQKKPKGTVRSPKSEVRSQHCEALALGPRISGIGLRAFLLCALGASLLAAPAARAGGPPKPSVDSIGNQVMCSCGCVAPLSQCPHLDCSTKAEMRAFIQKDISEGKDETAILQDVALRYGVQVLSAPPARGFSLAVWILPGVGLVAGLTLVVILARRWRHKPAAVPSPASGSTDPKLLAAVEQEMKSTGLG